MSPCNNFTHYAPRLRHHFIRLYLGQIWACGWEYPQINTVRGASEITLRCDEKCKPERSQRLQRKQRRRTKTLKQQRSFSEASSVFTWYDTKANVDALLNTKTKARAAPDTNTHTWENNPCRSGPLSIYVLAFWRELSISWCNANEWSGVVFAPNDQFFAAVRHKPDSIGENFVGEPLRDVFQVSVLILNSVNKCNPFQINVS
jgi:hypothetical protein